MPINFPGSTGRIQHSCTVAAASLFFLILTGPCVFAQEGLTPEQMAKIKIVTQATISPGGDYAAYILSIPADPEEVNLPNSTHLQVLNTETGDSQTYYSVTDVNSVAFRPGRESITFLAQREGDETRSLFELPVNGGEAARILSFRTNILSYEWASDGYHVAFTASGQLPPEESGLPYSPDIYEEGIPQRHAYIANVRQSDTEPRRINVDGSIYLMNWSPDDSKLAVSAAPSPGVDDYYMHQQVFVVDYRTLDIVARVDNEGKIGQIEWSPDGTRLALRAGSDIHDPIDGRILVVSAEGGNPRVIDRDFEGKYEQIAWTDEDRIHFIASRGVWRLFGSIAPDGNEKRIRLEEGPILNSFEPAEDGSILFTADTEAHPNEVFIMAPRDTQPKRMTVSNPWLDEVERGRQEVVRYESRDGEFEIEGLFIYPVGYSEGDSVPVITQVHGGPEAHYSNGWLTSYSAPGQMGAAGGYGVFYPNYRGSTGRGIDFVTSSQGDAGRREFDDIVDGIDYLVGRGIADDDRIGVTGGSYGGYASGWMSTYYSGRFAASVMFVGVSNNISKWGTSDIPDELYLVHARERIWEDNWTKYLERSPVYWVDRAETPILIMHGADDTRVHPAQSMELYRHLKVRKPDLPVRLVFYPGEGHGHIHSTARYDYTLRLFRWFDTYLLTGNADAELPPAALSD
ncbi:MAG: prolyl oligopeptidase family serine peptidase [Balneolaceae bacterium]